MRGDTPQTAWMREYERRKAAVVYAAGDHGKTRSSIYATEGDRDASRAALTSARTELDAHVRGLVEECERLRGALFRCVDGWTKGDDIAGPMRAARAALATPKDAP